jgi:hypothetical protein
LRIVRRLGNERRPLEDVQTEIQNQIGPIEQEDAREEAKAIIKSVENIYCERFKET